jgi:transcriptional regulator GlxA family with amidase domain
MPIINKSKQFLKEETEQKINQLCAWIEQNCANPISFADLTLQSGFDVNELMTLLGVYKKTTPMAFVRFCREMEKRKKEQPVNDLFSRSLLKKPEDML